MPSDTAKPLFHRTEVEAKKTAGECMTLLAEHGAELVAIAWEARQPAGLKFTIGTAWGVLSYDMPVRLGETERRLAKAHRERKITAKFTGTEQARRVAWRVLKRWLEVQVEFIELGQAELAEVMLPWMSTGDGQTVWTAFQADRQRALEAPQAGGSPS
jgi:hypothetical protein